MLFFSAALVWWVASGLAILVYFAVLLIIPRCLLLTELMLSDRVPAKDVANTSFALTAAIVRLNTVVRALPKASDPDLADLSRHLTSIREFMTSDPNDHRQTRQTIVGSCASLSRQVPGDNATRLTVSGTMIKAFVPVVPKIDRAWIENDFLTLQVQVSALQFRSSASDAAMNRTVPDLVIPGVVAVVSVGVTRLNLGGPVQRMTARDSVAVSMFYGGEKCALPANPSVAAILKDRYAVTTHTTKAGSVEMVTSLNTTNKVAFGHLAGCPSKWLQPRARPCCRKIRSSTPRS